MPTYYYDQRRIQRFLTERVDLEAFCFVLENRVRPEYAYRNLAGATPDARSRDLVQKAARNDELGELVYQLTIYWLDDIHGNSRVLRNYELERDLATYERELLDQGDQEKAGLVQMQLVRIGVSRPSPQPGPPPPPVTAPFKHGYAVLIGVGEHHDRRILPLPATVRDVHAIRKVLLDSALCGYLDEHVHLVTGPGATRQSILGALDWLAAQAQRDPEATALFYYSGHGWKDEQASQPRYCLIPYDCDWDRVDSTTVYSDLFTQKLNAVPAARLVVVLDACHAGGVTKDASPLPGGFAKSAPPTALLAAMLGAGRGKVVLSSSRENEYSYVRADNAPSVFTGCLIEAISGQAPTSRSDTIGILDLFNYLDVHVPAVIEAARLRDPYTGKPAQQHPVLDGTKTDNFPIALRQPSRR